MSKKKKARKTNPLKIQKILVQQTEKNNTLILGGVLLSMTSIGLLIFVLSDKVFHWYRLLIITSPGQLLIFLSVPINISSM